LIHEVDNPGLVTESPYRYSGYSGPGITSAAAGDLADQNVLVRSRIDLGAWNGVSLHGLPEPVSPPEADLPGRTSPAQKLSERDHRGPAAETLRKSGVTTGYHARWVPLPEQADEAPETT
jgi:hypothetical protein